MTIPATYSFILKDQKILLLKKAEGLFGAGKWFVPGGKLNPREDPYNCVVRETLEKTGLHVRDPVEIGRIHFYKDGRRDSPEWTGYVFVSTEFNGRLTEGREGRLRWFDVDRLPFDEMWAADPLWMNLALDRKRFEAWFYYTGDFENLFDHRIIQL